jgi:hypothetical protein
MIGKNGFAPERFAPYITEFKDPRARMVCFGVSELADSRVEKPDKIRETKIIVTFRLTSPNPMCRKIFHREGVRRILHESGLGIHHNVSINRKI